MLAKKSSDRLSFETRRALADKRTWIEIDSKAAKKNYNAFRRLLKPTVKLWSVVKSNAYGHGLVVFSKLADELGVDGFCVDSIVEGSRLREEGIKKPILVLGPTLPTRFVEAAINDITISISNFEALNALVRAGVVPSFHIKIDTGFHRQGFYLEDVPKVIQNLKSQISNLKSKFQGVFTHFAAAKDIAYPGYTEMQFENFLRALSMFKKAGFRRLIAHAAATGGTVLNPKYHLGAVRVGMGLYGYHASPELELQLDRIELEPVLRWRTVVSEVKKVRKGDYIGYDMKERMLSSGLMAVLPIGYWHGFPRALSSVGQVLVRGTFARVLGRVSMDLTAIDATKARCRPGDIVTLIGRDGERDLCATELARMSDTHHYEFLTRLNPLIERVLV
ncbi:MAG: alanine racemase [Patescibacteria group bacterium]|mgnify:FL=1